MEHIDWLKPENVNVLRVNLNMDSFLDDIKNQKCQQLRLVKHEGSYYVRYKLGRKVYWYEVSVHSFGDYLFTPKKELTGKIKDSINRKYLTFNRDWVISEILN